MNDLSVWLKNIVKNNQKLLNIYIRKKFYYFSIYCMYKMVDISTETWNKTGVSVISIHENDDINKTLLLLLCISGISKRWRGTNTYDLLIKKLRKNTKLKK